MNIYVYIHTLGMKSVPLDKLEWSPDRYTIVTSVARVSRYTVNRGGVSR